MEAENYKNAFGKVVQVDGVNGDQYNVFIPNPLPPNIEFDEELVLILSRAEEKLGKLSGVCLTLPSPNLLIIPYLRKEAIMSTRIEGTRISMQEVLLSEAKEREEKTKDAQEVVNYINTVNYALTKIEKSPINVELIKEMHKVLMEGVRGDEKAPGEFREVQNWIGSELSKVSDANFVPPNPEAVPKLMEDLIEYLNTEHNVPVLVRCALMHYQFETIHPFCDGNGRIGRSLITVYLCKKKKIIKPLLYISEFFEKHRLEYNELLLKTGQTGKFEGWIKFFLKAVEVQSEDASVRAHKLLYLRESYRKRVQREAQSSDILNIIDYLFSNPFITVKRAQHILDVTYPTGKKYVEKLVEYEILKETNRLQREKTFVAYEIYEIIKDI
ncbi:MAG: Fic/DOC family protein [Candidatus Methanofastidiosum methylothiophilum]|jgi:Fic family protein|uniref:Fic/DOC family protein n=1 Tax=Candidatus Methanofastidiosum methylothiophilum TaxID=1705564 RepID=A0A150JAJ0_9EURY|nr:MAG: Fic/DOC family protein [Candidatus Methanofastidiosum methylthiophilus]OQC18163.1 MAG: Adenosine monophosphate-protein transferase SoFic [Firmicutes bacterium ADurb.Bin080]